MKNSELETLTLKELAVKIGYTDLRSVYRWCANNGVVVLFDNGTRVKYVVRSEFEAARMKTFVVYLKKRYGEKHWVEAFKAHMNFNISHILDLDSAGKKDHTRVSKNIPSSTSKNSERFLSDLNNL